MICSRIIWMLCVLISTISPILADTFCSGTYCSGNWAFCCGSDDELCCYNFVYDYWWFWFIWVLILFAIISCSIYCCRRHRQNSYYLIPDQSARGYGTVSVSSTSTTVGPPAYPATQYQMPPSAPTYPPQYQPSQKPPGYIP
ncbi:WW domain binding protein 1-like [Gigantopelta aegis]|uniref:WW domain binding protein 1-like n=1 Tax=Gigantopelta aegis TaxID=1735272 RepID=UPI001B889122|nr:WW domain binding protein 1-like [Gigantopelta aegis]